MLHQLAFAISLSQVGLLDDCQNTESVLQIFNLFGHGHDGFSLKHNELWCYQFPSVTWNMPSCWSWTWFPTKWVFGHCSVWSDPFHVTHLGLQFWQRIACLLSHSWWQQCASFWDDTMMKKTFCSSRTWCTDDSIVEEEKFPFQIWKTCLNIDNWR